MYMHALYNNIMHIHWVFHMLYCCRDYTRHDPGELDLDDRGLDVGMH